MTVAVISLVTPQTVVAVFGGLPPSFHLPDGRVVNAAQVGWVSQDGDYSLVNVTPFVVPNGQIINGAPTYAASNGIVTQTFPTIATPAPTAALNQYSSAVTAGITLTWTTSTALNGNYALDPITINKLTTEWIALQALAVFSNGTALEPWPLASGTRVNMSAVQFKAFATAVLKYMAQILAAEVSQAGGGNPTWPSANVTITG